MGVSTAAQLDFSTLDLVPAHYVSSFLSQRESDIVWKVRYVATGRHSTESMYSAGATARGLA